MKEYRWFFLVAVSTFLLFLGVFKSLQVKTIYHATLGKVSQNYERGGTWEAPVISRVSKPYTEMSSDNFRNWDAAIYYCIKETGYDRSETSCYSVVKSAFFPLFPFAWRLSGLSPFGISVLNFFLFCIAIAILMRLLIPQWNNGNYISYALLISLPSMVVFLIPYSEAFFVFFGSLAAYGFVKKKYRLYFVAMMLMAMVRPATLFVLVGLAFCEILLFSQHKNASRFIKQMCRNAAPMLVGYLLVACIFKLSSGSWTTYLDAQKQWAGGIQRIKEIVDWSIEGFGLSSATLFFVAIPVLIVAIIFIRRMLNRKMDFDTYSKTGRIHYLILLSCSYISGILIFTLLTSGGNMHSFFRFILGSPFFFILAIWGVSQLQNEKPIIPLIGFLGALILFALFMIFVPFGGSRLDFSYLGSILLIGTLAILIFKNRLPHKLALVISISTFGLNIIWTTYLFNAFLSNGWLFT